MLSSDPVGDTELGAPYNNKANGNIEHRLSLKHHRSIRNMN